MKLEILFLSAAIILALITFIERNNLTLLIYIGLIAALLGISDTMYLLFLRDRKTF